MRKVELIYLHALLAQVHDHLADRHDVPEQFDDYETNHVGPYQIQRRKDEHEAAVQLLADRLVESLPESEREPELQKP